MGGNQYSGRPYIRVTRTYLYCGFADILEKVVDQSYTNLPRIATNKGCSIVCDT